MRLVLASGILATVVLAMFASPVRAQEAEVAITSAKEASKTKILIPDFIREGGFNDKENRDVKMADILAADLNFSGYFEATRVHEVLGDPSGWTSLGVDNIVQGSYSTDGREIHLTCKVMETAAGTAVYTGKYPDALRVMRQKVHQMADDIIFRVAGQKGICRTRIAFVSDMTGHDELYYSDYDGHNVYRLTRDEGTCLLPGWSPSGNYITYTSYKRLNPDLWWVSSTAKSRGILSFFQGLNVAASWSPDGERIALSLSKDGNSEIYTMKRDGSGHRRLTINHNIDTSPSWSPTGREIAFNSDRSGSPQIYVMDSEGGNVRRLSYIGKYNASPCWSPKGDSIVYVSREAGYFSIYKMDPTGENVTRLTFEKGQNENPSWSPDGKHIVFSSTRSGRKELYTMDPDGKNVRRLNIPGNAQTPAWSPMVQE
ncbi:MAG: Tol-Pal system beta propeller repeat protein TolB [Nitrospirae bacterium]|nr:Tol-Pal system beta propeller repeat protein TolB [Nitrospirota bacterium]